MEDDDSRYRASTWIHEEGSLVCKRHNIVNTSLAGLCLALATACGATGSAATATTPTAAPQTQSPTATPGGAYVVPAGFKQIGGAANGLTVAVPESWVALDLTKDDLEQGLRQNGLSGAALERAEESLRALAAAKAVWASDPKSAETSPTRFATNLNGFCQPSGSASSDEIIIAAKSQLEQVNANVSEAIEVPVDAGKAVRIVYTFTNGGLEIRGTQFHVPGKGKTCIVTLSTDQDGKQALFDQIGRTIRPI